MKSANFMIFNRVFSQNTLEGFIRNDNPIPYIVAIKRSAIVPNGKTNKTIISEIYKYMASNYRNEYIYKNTLLNRLLLDTKKHNIENTTALAEIPVGRSKADFILINGHAEVYEVKTELDNFDRLENQIHNYYKAFDHVNIVIPIDKLHALQNILTNTRVGIYILDKKLKINEIKKSRSEKKYLEHKTIFKILRKKEYENIIFHCYGSLPIVSQFDYYKECLKLFSGIGIEKVYPLFCSELKKRCNIEKKVFLSLPKSINSLVYFSNLKKADVDKLSTFLNSEYYGGKNVLSIS